MKHLQLSTHFALTLAFLLLCCFAAQAQHRVFVSGVGDDANPCTNTFPCRNFQRGHDAVAAGGEVVAMDSAGYGQLTITKSVTITGVGVSAGITATSGNAITIATAGITVNLRSLSLQGNSGGGNNGIIATDFAALHIENCIVNGFGSQGIFANVSSAGTRKVFIKDCISRNNLSVGIDLTNTGGGRLIATIERTRTENNNGAGIYSYGAGSTVTARGCLASGNTFAGFASDTGGVLNIESSVASNNDFGIRALNAATVRVSDSTVTNNTGFGFRNESSTFESRVNNTVAGNNGGGAQTGGTITPIAGT